MAWAEPTAAEKETARTLVQSGRDKRKEGDIKAALADFQAAHAIMKVPTTGLEVGKTQIELGLLVEARDTLLDVTRLPADRKEPRAFVRARTESKKLAESLATRIPSLHIRLSGIADNEVPKVLVDDTAVVPEALGAPLRLNPGTHTVVVRIGEKERAVEVSLKEQETREVQIDLSDLAPKPAPPMPVVGPTTKTNPLVFIGYGAGGLGLLAGTITGVLAITTYASVTAQCDRGRCPPETHGKINTGKTLGTISTISFIVAGAGAIAGTVGLFLPIETQSSSTTTATKTTWIGLDPTSVSVSGIF